MEEIMEEGILKQLDDMIFFTQDYFDLLLQTYRFLNKITAGEQYNWKRVSDEFNMDWSYVCSMDTQCGLISSFLLEVLSDKNKRSKTLEFYTPSKFSGYNNMIKKISAFVGIDKITTPTLFEISIPSEEIFPGHVMTFITIPTQTENVYYCMQSFVHQYTPKLKRLTKDEFMFYINNYAMVFRSINKKNETTIHEDIWEICTWTPYNIKLTEVLEDTDFFVEITKIPLSSSHNININYIKFISIGYGMFLSLRFFIKNLFNISNEICACKFLRSGKFLSEKSKCQILSGNNDIDNTIYNKYRPRYSNIRGNKNNVINIFKFYEFISDVFKTDDPNDFVVSFNRSFSTNLLDPNSDNILLRLEDYIKRFENSLIKLLSLRIHPHLGETRRYFLCIFLSVVEEFHGLFDKIDPSDYNNVGLLSDQLHLSSLYKESLFWLENINKNSGTEIEKYKIFEILSIVEFINNIMYPDIKYFFFNVRNHKFTPYIAEKIGDTNDDVSKFFQSTIEKYTNDDSYKTFVHTISHPDFSKRFNSDFILNSYFKNCDNKGINNSSLLESLINFINDPLPYGDIMYKILLFSAIRFTMNIT